MNQSNKLTLICFEIRTDGPLTGFNSIIDFGAVRVDPSATMSIGDGIRPVSGEYREDWLAKSGFTRGEHESFSDPVETMRKIYGWLGECGPSPVFVTSDPLCWSFMHYYFQMFYGDWPFKGSGWNLESLFCGMIKNLRDKDKWRLFGKPIRSGLPIEKARNGAMAMAGMIDRGLKL